MLGKPTKTFPFISSEKPITTAAAAAILNRSQAYVRDRIKSGDLAAVAFGGRCYAVRYRDVVGLKRRNDPRSIH